MIRGDGVAQSSTRVSSLMRNIDSSDWLKNPALEVVESKKGDGLGSSFILDAEQVSHAGSIDDDDTTAGPERRIARRGATP